VELEDCAAALFQASQHFVECNVTEADVLELDVVATSYTDGRPLQTLAEAKSGQWGYGEIFKLYGWMKYLGIENGALFVTKVAEDKNVEMVREKVGPLGIQLLHLDSENLADAFAAAGCPAITDRFSVDLWRFSYAIQRTFIRYLQLHRNSNPVLEGPRTALRYHALVNHGVFFEPNPRNRLRQLYADFSEHPKLSLGLARDEDTATFDCNTEDPKNHRIWEAIYEGKHDAVQAAMYIEHRARLALLKTAIDLYCLGTPEPRPVLTHKGKVVVTEDDLLPPSFRRAFDELKKEPFVSRYAVFWQVFLWGFGGFYLQDRRDAEFEWLSSQTGIPLEEVPRALKAFDKLFPTSGGTWFGQTRTSHCVVVKMVPTAMQGIGAFQRSDRYGLKSYADLGYTDMTAKDLSKWHNKSYETLKMRERFMKAGGL